MIKRKLKLRDLNLLTNSQGVGKRIAERLVVELKNKLQQFTKNAETNNGNNKSNIPSK